MLLDFDVVGDSDLAWLGSGHTGVCIVGAGAAGILLATQLVGRGLTVTLLEAGGLDLEAKSQSIYNVDLAGLPYRGATAGRFRTYGGSTTQWGGQILELEEFDFEKRAHVAGSGWPIRKSELREYYDRALQFEGLRNAEHDDAKVWSRLGLSLCDLGPEFRMKYSRWCPERDFSLLHRETLTHSSRLRVLYHANLVGISLDEHRQSIHHLKIQGYGGRTWNVSARTFVLCTGAIEAVRLLLQPLESGLAPWQTNGLLGAHYQDHIALNGLPISDIALKPTSKYFGYEVLAGFRYHNKILLSQQEQIAAESLNVAATVGPLRKGAEARDAATVALREMVRKKRSITPQGLLTVAPHALGIGYEMARRLAFGDEPAWKRTMLTVHCEQSPLSASSISLSDQRDALGLLKARIDWQISSQEIRSLRNYVRRAAEIFSHRRFARVQIPKGFFEDDSVVVGMCTDSNHHMGGARMATSATEGIVDTHLKLHGISNGYICSSAVFPTSGFSNPTHTLLALAMRLVDHLEAGTMGLAARSETSVKLSREMRRVRLAPRGNLIPQLGFGCSYLLGPGIDRDKALRLLAAAYDAGIRYFDTARLYGQGRCETLLGEFLKSHPDAKVGTKFGMEPPNLVQRGFTAAARRVPGMRGVADAVRGSGKVRFDGATARASLERSLRALGREEVELLLLHEAERLDLVHDDLLEFLEEERRRGRIRNFGIGGEYGRVAELYATRRAHTPVLQFEHSVFRPPVEVAEATQVHYRTFARPAAALRARLSADKKLAWWWSELVGLDLLEHGVLPRLFLRASVDEYPDVLTLFSASQESHIYDCVDAMTDERLEGPALRLRKLVREDDLGIGRELYGRGV